jgi:trimeric autotransporter adhesin
MKFVLLFLFVFSTSIMIYSQNNNIVNTLGPGGSFTVRDANGTYLSVTEPQVQIKRNILLENTSNSSLGIIFKGTESFIHNYSAGLFGNTFVGLSSGNFTMNSAAISNTALGANTLYNNMSGYANTAVGIFSLNQNIEGFQNTSLGAYSLFQNTFGTQNTAVGYAALSNNSTAFQNTAVGHHALESNNGNYNTAVGYNAGSAVTTGANLTLLGIDANPSSPTATDQVTLGNIFVNSLRCNVQNISSLSDARDKKNIRDLDLGIDFLMKIKPRLFNWDKRDWYDDKNYDGSKVQDRPTAGFIAQELDEIQINGNAEWLKLVLKDNPEKLEATPGNLLPVIVKAVQDLKTENDQLKASNKNLEEVIAELTDRVKRLEQVQAMLLSYIQKQDETQRVDVSLEVTD